MKERESNFELLRLVAISMIVLIHINMYMDHFTGGIVGQVYTSLINGICNVGVTLFILVSGYFGVKLDVKKLIKLDLRMITYSVVVMVITLLLYFGTYSMGDMLELATKTFMPFITRAHWFYSCYVLIVIFSGPINTFASSLKKEDFRRLLIVMFIVFSALPTFFYYEVIPDNGKGFTQMFMVYLMGRYIRLHGISFLEKEKNKPLLWVVFVLLWAVNGLSHRFPITLGGIYHHLCKDNSITNLTIALILFYLFKELKFKAKAVNGCAKYVFAIFAMNYALIDLVMYVLLGHKEIIPANPVLGVILLLLITFLITMACVFVGIIREYLFSGLDEHISAFISGKIESLRMLP